MAAFTDGAARKGRYRRDPADGALALSPEGVGLLLTVAEYRLVSLPQLARRAGLTPKRARRNMRLLFDHGLVDIVPVPRVALAAPTEANDASLLYGSAPNIYTLTREGLKLLRRLGCLEGALPAATYGPRNTLFLAHELAIRDVRLWFELAARAYGEGHSLERWVDGGEAKIDLGRLQPPTAVRPDAWFVYRLPRNALVGLLEVDRGTERGDPPRRWQEKLAAYQALYAGERLKEVTGYANARVLVVTLNPGRRDRLAELIAEHAKPELAARFWLADRTDLFAPSLTQAAWGRPGMHGLQALVPPEIAG